jgi:hypothetical protein
MLWHAGQARPWWHAGQAINEVWQSILLNKFSKKIVFTMNGVDRGTLI